MLISLELGIRHNNLYIAITYLTLLSITKLVKNLTFNLQTFKVRRDGFMQDVNPLYMQSILLDLGITFNVNSCKATKVFSLILSLNYFS